jgi:DNA-binding CsgD family transcriptional regulator/sugar-specific transcriptional regulator TrmB
MLESMGLSAEAAEVYRAMLDEPGVSVEQLGARLRMPAPNVRSHLDDLADLMLVRASADHPGRLCAVSPEVGLADLLARQEVELAQRQARLAQSRAALTSMVAERAAQGSAAGDRLLGLDAIRTRLAHLARGVRRELIGVQPGVQRPDDLQASADQNVAALKRGVEMRTLYQDVVRNHAHVVAHAHRLLSHGGEVRTAPVIPRRTVIFDRVDAIVPIDPSDSRKGALHVTEPGLVAILLEHVEQAWSTAVPLGAVREDDPDTGLTATERELLRLLGAGLTDETAGRRLGLSLRTVRRHMASIMERLGASSRFEAGIKAAQRGWL